MTEYSGNLSGARLLFFGSAAASAAGFFSGVILAHMLGPDDRGIVAAVFSFFMLLRFMCSFGAIETATAAQGWDGYSYGFVLKQVLIWSVLGMAVVMPLAWIFRTLLLGDEVNVDRLIIVAFAVLPFAVFSDVIRGALLAKHRMLAAALHIVSMPVVRLLGVVGLLVVGLHTVEASIIVSLVGAILGFIVVALVSARVDRKFGFGKIALGNRVSAVRLHKFSVRLAPGIVARIANRRLDQVLLLGLAGSAELGYYAVAVAVAEIPDILTRVFRQKTLADQTAKPNPEGIKRSLRLSILMFTIVAVPLAILTPFVVPLLFGEKFQPAVLPLCILLLAGLFNVIREVAGVSFLINGRPGTESLVHMAGLVLGVSCLYILAPEFGAVGASLAALISYCVVSLLLIVGLSYTGKHKLRELLVPTSSEFDVLAKYVEKFNPLR